ncbi:anti-sigma factor family protein [Marinivivus vitaminiproducens]|uniref:anti-sigma factor family protein n=1 Tax=Marinivivus vitaminiproducens TaxID=3035935 RepID=UPI0027A95A88|nr:hypothetical protein P4R82_14165 [Geminicoccaceae bacterium SCSIO 64248]
MSRQEIQPTSVGEEDLQAFVDDQLPLRRRPVVESFLAEHPDIAERLIAQREHNSTLRALSKEMLLEAAPESLGDLEIALAGVLRRRTQIRRAAMSMAAMLVVGVVGGVSWYGYYQPQDDQVAAIAQQSPMSPALLLAQDRRVVSTSTGTRPANGGQGETPAPASDAWLASETVKAPDLRILGFAIVDARAAASAISLVYERNHPEQEPKRTEQVLLQIGPLTTNRVSDDSLAERGPMLAWREGPLLYRLGGTIMAPDLLAVFQTINDESRPPDQANPPLSDVPENMRQAPPPPPNGGQQSAIPPRPETETAGL